VARVAWHHGHHDIHVYESELDLSRSRVWQIARTAPPVDTPAEDPVLDAAIRAVLDPRFTPLDLAAVLQRAHPGRRSSHLDV
jgi:hypothetical protein